MAKFKVIIAHSWCPAPTEATHEEKTLKLASTEKEIWREAIIKLFPTIRLTVPIYKNGPTFLQNLIGHCRTLPGW